MDSDDQGFLNLHVAKWVRTMITRAVAIVPTIIVAVSFTSQLDNLDQLLNILQSIQLPFALIPLLAFISCEEIVGDFALSRRSQVIVGSCILAIIGINVYLVVDTVSDYDNITWYGYLLISLGSILYLVFVGYISYISLNISRGFKDGYVRISSDGNE